MKIFLKWEIYSWITKEHEDGGNFVSFGGFLQVNETKPGFEGFFI